MARIVNWSEIATTRSATPSIPIGAGSGNRVLIVVEQLREGSGNPTTGISYGGQALTQIATEENLVGADLNSAVWILDEAGIAAASGDTIAFTPNSSAGSTFRCAAGAYDDVDQTSIDLDNFTSVSPSGGTEPATSTALTSEDGGLVFLCYGINQTTNGDATYTNLTEQVEISASGIYLSVGEATASGSSFTPNASLTLSPSNGLGTAIAFSLAAASGGNTNGSGTASIVTGGSANTSFAESTDGLNAGTRRVFVSKSGNDSNNGLSSGAAKLTIGAALSIAQAGDVISIGSGHYFETPSVSGLAGTLSAPIWIVAERRGEVTISHYWEDAYNGTQVWTDEGNGVYSASHVDAWSGSYAGDFLFRYLTRADLEAASITVDGLVGTNVITKPQYGFAEEGGTFYLKLRDGENPNGKKVKITDDFSETIVNFSNCDNIIFDGIRVEGSGDTPAVVFDADCANPTIRNCITNHCRGLVRASDDVTVKWNEFTNEGYQAWMRELIALDGISTLGLFDIHKNYNITSGNTHYEGGILFGTDAADSGTEVSFNWIHGLFEGMRAGEHDNQKIHDNVLEEIGDNAVEFLSFRNSDLSADIEFYNNLLLNVHDSFTAHQGGNAGNSTGPHHVYRNVFVATDPLFAEPRWIIKMINTDTHTSLSGINYYHNYIEITRGNSGHASPSTFSSLWADDFSVYHGDFIDVMRNNVAVYSDGMDSGPGPNPVDIQDNALAAPSDNTTFQANGGFRVANKAALTLGSNRQPLTGSPLIGAAGTLPGSLPDSTGLSQADIGPFPFGFDPGADWPRPRRQTFDTTRPTAFQAAASASAAIVSGGSANAQQTVAASASAAVVSGGSALANQTIAASGTAAMSSAGSSNAITIQAASGTGTIVSGGSATALQFFGNFARAEIVTGGSANASIPPSVAPPTPLDDSFLNGQRPVILIELDFDQASLNIWTRPAQGEFDGKTYNPLDGVTSGISIRNSLESGSFDASLQLSAQSDELLAIALAGEYRGRPARVKLGNLIDNGQGGFEVENAETILTGTMSNMVVSDTADSSDVAIVINSVFRDLNRPTTLRISSSDQETISPGDSIFDFVDTAKVTTPRFGG